MKAYLSRIRKVGPRKWKRKATIDLPYMKLIMFRLKVIFGEKLRRLKFDAQAVELSIQCAMINLMIRIGKPKSYMG